MSNEITVRLKCSIKELRSILENKGFSLVDDYTLEDIFYIKKDIDISEVPIRNILTKYILIRKVTQLDSKNHNESIKLTLKNKQIAEDGTIIWQEKRECQINSIKDGKNFIEGLDYKELMTIKEHDFVYQSGDFSIAIKDIDNGENLIEIETIADNEEFNTIDKLKERINNLQIPIDTNDYFVKKAEIELKKLL